MTNEVWRDIKGYEGYYQVSNQGRVRTLTRQTVISSISRKGHEAHEETWERKSRILKPIGERTEYVHLYKEGLPRKSVAVKRLVAEAFIDEFTEDMKTSAIRLHIPYRYNVENITIKHSTPSSTI